MKIATLWMIALLAAAASAAAQTTQPRAKISCLIVDGMNNHDWPRATRILKSILETSGRFTVDVATSPPSTRPAHDDAWKAWRPAFERYDVVVSNFNGGHVPGTAVHWPPDVRDALEAYVRDGGGLVIYHAANNAFPDWRAYHDMVGLAWRPPDFGPSIVIDAKGRPVTIPQGQGRKPGHGPEHDFLVTTLAADHPITRGLPRTWMHPHDQLTHGQHGPAKHMTVLTYAWSKDSRENEPMDWVVPFGKGRVYTTVLGHLWKDGPDTAMRCAGFQTLLQRGAEWAATGAVTGPVPADFPTADAPRLRPPLDP